MLDTTSDGHNDPHAHVATFEALAEVGYEHLLKLGRGVGIVSGPITTGGLGSREANMARFSHTIDLIGRTCKLFDQRPFEHAIRRLRHNWQAQTGNLGYCMPILDVFYARLIRSGFITHGFFIPGWKSSKGAQWEHDELNRIGAQLVYLPDTWFEPQHIQDLNDLLAA